YDSAQVLDKAITQANSVKSADLVKVLQSGITFDSPRGPLQLDPQTHNPIENFYVVKDVKQNNFIVGQPLETIPNVAMPASQPAN
ncbi:MAG: ABC transporter substrate-binding protein, partial [Alicyclobacillus sp.]|nr:ABC transporter substrate-binding protein [Alicyclobacillus sp.]